MHTNNKPNKTGYNTYKAKDFRIEIIWSGNGCTDLVNRTNKWLSDHPDLDIISVDLSPTSSGSGSYIKINYLIKTE